jgi:hypothetical protein
MLSIELARRLKAKGSKVTVNVMNPGLIPTTGNHLQIRSVMYYAYSLSNNLFYHSCVLNYVYIVNIYYNIQSIGLFRDLNPLFVFIFSFLTTYVFKVAATEQEGGRRLAYLVSSSLLNTVSGAYFSGKPGVSEFNPISPSVEAQDEKKGKLLYELTAKLCRK